MTQLEMVNQIINFCDSVHATSLEKSYIVHLYQSLNRFVESNVTFGDIHLINDFSLNGYDSISQKIIGDENMISYITSSPSILMAFAEKYSDMQIEPEEYDELALDCLADFLNLNNGLFLVEYTDEYSVSQTLDVPVLRPETFQLLSRSIHVPANFSFGCIHFIITF